MKYKSTVLGILVTCLKYMRVLSIEYEFTHCRWYYRVMTNFGLMWLLSLPLCGRLSWMVPIEKLTKGEIYSLLEVSLQTIFHDKTFMVRTKRLVWHF